MSLVGTKRSSRGKGNRTSITLSPNTLPRNDGALRSMTPDRYTLMIRSCGAVVTGRGGVRVGGFFALLERQDEHEHRRDLIGFRGQI